VILMAGGQGTRLGSLAPKGCYDIKLPSGKSLYQIEVERLVRLKTLAANKAKKDEASISLPLYIMTSDATKEASKSFFSEQKFFGLPQKDVYFFEQGLLPALTFDGKIIMETPTKPALSPNGNGGVYLALKVSGVLDDFKRRGVEYVHLFGVDNVLVKAADPTYIGFSVSSKADCTNKVVHKRDPHEKVGVMCLRNKKPSVVEYTEISKDQAEAQQNGRLVYGDGNVVQHFYTVPFLQKMATTALPYHLQKKKIPYVTGEGKTVTPTTENGIKFEMFVFDVFEYANVVAFEVPREGEFTPVKNADGIDSPESARNELSAYHKKLAQQAGATFTSTEGLFEISPLLSYQGENLAFLKGQSLSPQTTPHLHSLL